MHLATHLRKTNRVREGWPVGRLKQQSHLDSGACRANHIFFSLGAVAEEAAATIQNPCTSFIHSFVHSFTLAAYTSGMPPVCCAICGGY